MKLTKKALLAATPFMVNDFEHVDDVFLHFEVAGLQHYYWGEDKEGHEKSKVETLKKLNKKYKILYADYTYEGYEGDAYILGYNKQEGKFFEVHGSHCSCYGLEGQWVEEYCTLAELNEVIDKRFKADISWRQASSDTFENWLKNVVKGGEQ